ncbi:uncharacterized protein LOC128334243 isoform X2 [Hemicordylus capensis]|uniref:uncharacterized protein LOC128334243 isoform X2 n=1 Tax=Hemicordylus capensis TaxID=884348 RepID=UPI0023045955|nr:uncharacterized protein LOC128334243 isoform X2 [Hemicordylus capensis]
MDGGSVASPTSPDNQLGLPCPQRKQGQWKSSILDLFKQRGVLSRLGWLKAHGDEEAKGRKDKVVQEEEEEQAERSNRRHEKGRGSDLLEHNCWF